MHQVSATFVSRLLLDQKLNNFPSVKISKEQMMAKTFQKISLPVTRHVSTVMTLKPNNNPHTGKVMLLVSFDHQGIANYEVAPEGQLIKIFVCRF
jgi:hypothetical protein